MEIKQLLQVTNFAAEPSRKPYDCQQKVPNRGKACTDVLDGSIWVVHNYFSREAV